MNPILKIEPEHELLFKGPLQERVSVVLKLTNIAERKACFKTKTTAPKRYCVKPTEGVIDSKTTVTILITRQPFDVENEKTKHKFKVLSMLTTSEDNIIREAHNWKDASLEINEWKLTCVHETTAPVPIAKADGAIADDDALDANSSPRAQDYRKPKSEPILKVEPEQGLRIRGSFTRPFYLGVTLKNTTEKMACFKIKFTNASKVKAEPAIGAVASKGTVTIAITFHPFDLNDRAEKRRSHKLQVLSVLAPDGQFDIQSLWEDTSLEIHDKRLKCVFELSDRVGSEKDGVASGGTLQSVAKAALDLSPEDIKRIKQEMSTWAEDIKNEHNFRFERFLSVLIAVVEETTRLIEETSV